GNDWSPLLPVVPGIPVAASIHTRALTGETARAFLEWMPLGAEQNGPATTVAATASTGATAAPLDRLTMTATPPANVHVARIRLTGAAQHARPCVTWTPQVQPWRPGGGAE